MGKETRRYSLKTIAMNFPSGSMERCYLHGLWQKERGRNVTLLYGNHTKPREAFASAEMILSEYIAAIRKKPFSRCHNWSTWVAKVMKRVPVEDI